MRLVTSVLSPTASPSILRMMSPLLNPALAAGPSFSTVPISAPSASGRPKLCASDWSMRLDADADAAVLDLAVRAQLVRDLGGDVRRNRERQAHVAAGAAVDLRVHADDLAGRVEQRATRVAGVHRDVGLDERRHLPAGQRAMHAAHDAGRYAVLEAERRADRDHPLAALHRRRRGQVERGQVLAVDLDERDVRALVRADHLGGELAAVGEAHRHFARAVDHVRVGHDVAVGAHDEARADAARGHHARLALRALRAAEATQEIAERVVRIDVVLVERGLLDLARRADVDHGRSGLVDQRGEIRQAGRGGGRDGRGRERRRRHGGIRKRDRGGVEVLVARGERRAEAGRRQGDRDLFQLHGVSPVEPNPTSRVIGCNTTAVALTAP